MKQFILIALILFSFSQIEAQIKATTESGNTVLLHKNGTWEYYEASTEQKSANPQVATASTTATITIDNTVTKESERFELFNTISPKMAKYFGEEKGKIKCYTTITNNKGEVTIRFELNAPVGDGYRYFGRSLEGRNITLFLNNDKEISLTINQQTEERFLDKWNQSFFIGACQLSKDDINILYHENLLKLDVDWKKNPETYEIENKKRIQEALKSVL